MKLLKYIIFLSILGSIFIVLYCNSDNKGFRRWWISFRMAVVIEAIVTGLIPNSADAIEPYGTSNLSSVERVLKIEGADQSKFGPGARAKADARPRAKTQRGVADASFLVHPNYSPYQKLLSGKRPAKIRKGQFDPDQDQRKGTCKSDIKETKTYNIDNHKKLTKISNKIHKNPKLIQEFNGLEQKLKNGNMKAGRGVKFLPNSNGIYYARAYTEGARLYFQYSGDNILILVESNKPTQDAVIEFLLKND